MPYELRLLLLSICVFVIWPGTVTVFLPFLAIGWLFISAFLAFFPLD